MERNITAEGVSVVIVGSFNPALFSPSWFLSEELIGRADWEDSEVGVISTEVSSFRMGWLELNANPNQLQLSTTQPEEFVRLRDAAIGTLRALRGTPVSALGINRDVHITVDSIERWHTVGHVLVPKEPWAGVLDSPGMRSVVLWGTRPDPYPGRIQVVVEPSQRYPRSIYVQTNDHYQFTRGPEQPDATDGTWDLSEIEPPSARHAASVISVLEEEWDASLARAEKVESRVVELGYEGVE